MKCVVCSEKEFSIIIESHLPAENQPVITCEKCFNNLLICHPKSIRVKIQEIVKGRRCAIN